MPSRREFLGATIGVGGMLAAGLPSLLSAAEALAAAAAAPDDPGEQPPAAGGHILPPLPYAHDALEPHIDAQTMRVHHERHHAAYVAGLNAAEQALAAARAAGDHADIAKHQLAIAFHGSGHVNHSIFWRNMGPAASVKPRPEGELAHQLSRDFGGLDPFRAQFQAAAVRVEGNGWGVLAWHPMLRRLQTLAFTGQQNSQLTGAVPLLMCDVWEHAYYLRYQNRRADYVTAWWNVVDWADVERRFLAARGRQG